MARPRIVIVCAGPLNPPVPGDVGALGHLPGLLLRVAEIATSD